MPIVERIERGDCLGPAGLIPAWRALWARVPGATPFQHPAWLVPWWQVFGNAALRMSALWDGERLLGLLPLYELPDEGKILPLGVGLSDSLDALIDPDAPADTAARLLASALCDARMPCHLPELPPGSPLRDARPPAGWIAETHPGSACPVLAPVVVPARQRRKLALARHRLRRAGGATADLDDTCGFPILCRLHAARWQTVGQPGVLADAAVRDFLAMALPGLRAAGLAAVAVLRLGGEAVAAVLTLRRNERIFLFLSGYDPARAFESPGTALLGTLLEQPMLREAHFLRGREDYKYSWGAVDQWHAMRVLQPG